MVCTAANIHVTLLAALASSRIAFFAEDSFQGGATLLCGPASNHADCITRHVLVQQPSGFFFAALDASPRSGI